MNIGGGQRDQDNFLKIYLSTKMFARFKGGFNMFKKSKLVLLLTLTLLLPGIILQGGVARIEAAIQPGKAMFSFVNLDYDNDSIFYVDEFIVYDVNNEQIAFRYDFFGEDGAPWHSGAFGSDLYAWPKDLVRYSIENNTGKLEADQRREGTGSSFAKVVSTMDTLAGSEVFMRFKVNEVKAGSSKSLRLYVQSDKFGSGSSYPENGYGVSINFGNFRVDLQSRENKSTVGLGRVTLTPAEFAAMATDWHCIRLQAAGDTVKVKIWNDKDQEPEIWLIESSVAP